MVTVLDLIELESAELVPDVCGADVLLRFHSLRSARSTNAADFLLCAQAFESMGMNEDGILACDEAIRRDGLFSQAYSLRAELLLSEFVARDDQGSEASLGVRALSDYERALSLTGSAAIDLVVSFAMALALTADYARCVHVIESSLPAHRLYELKSRSELLYILGFALLFCGNSERAISVFEEIVELKVSAADGVFGLAVCGMLTDESSIVSERELGAELAASLHELRVRGCRAFLDVARAVAAA